LILKDLSTRCVGVCPKTGKKGLPRSIFGVDTTEGFSYGYNSACGKMAFPYFGANGWLERTHSLGQLLLPKSGFLSLHSQINMEARNLFEKLADLSPGMEIWWDSSPVIFDNWCKRTLAKAKSDQDRQLLQKQFDRMYAPMSPLKQLFRGVTTNPSLSLQAIQEDVPCWEKVTFELIDQNPGIDKEGLFWKLYKTVVKRGSDMYLPLFEASGFKGWPNWRFSKRLTNI
jgi:hypothetical protein